MEKKRVIIVTDGDYVACDAVEKAAQNIGGRCISRSAGNPTPVSGRELVELIKSAKYDPVVVMTDDRGHTGKGMGEEALDYMLNDPEIDILGVIAVASNTKHVNGVKVDYSVNKNCELVNIAVDKYGNNKNNKIIKGDTVDILNRNDVPVIIGIGDPGKMDGLDSAELGAPVITKAMEEIIKKHDKAGKH